MDAQQLEVSFYHLHTLRDSFDQHGMTNSSKFVKIYTAEEINNKINWQFLIWDGGNMQGCFDTENRKLPEKLGQ